MDLLDKLVLDYFISRHRAFDLPVDYLLQNFLKRRPFNHFSTMIPSQENYQPNHAENCNNHVSPYKDGEVAHCCDSKIFEVGIFGVD